MVHQSSADISGATWAHAKGGYETAEPTPDQTVAPYGADAHAEDHAGAPLALTAGDHTEPGTIFGFDPHKVMYYISAVIGTVGILIAAFLHGAPGLAGLFIGNRTKADEVRADAIANSIRPVNKWAERKWFVDEFYQLVIVNPLKIFAHLFHWFDKVFVDIVLVDGTARLPKALASVLRTTQTGVLQGYAIRMIGGVALAAVIAAVLAL